MLARLSDFVIRIADLAEAEGRSAKRHLARLGVMLILCAVVAVLALLTLIIFARAMYLGLVEIMHPAAAHAFVALVLLVLTIATAACAKLIHDRDRKGEL